MDKLFHTSFHRRRALRTLTSALLMMVLTLGITPTGVSAASSWSPTLLVNTEAFQQIDSGNGTSDIELRFGSSTQTIKFLYNATATLRKFQFSHGISVLGTISGSALNIDRNATVGGTLTVTGAITGVNSITAKTVLSGNTLFISNSARVRGTLSASGTVALEGLLTGATIAGFGLYSCNGASQKIIYNSGTGKFECGTDVDTNTTYTAGQGLTLNGTSFSLSNSFSGTTVKVYGSLSGANIHAEQTLTSSGTLTADGIIRTKSNLTINSDSDTNDAVFTFGNQSGDQTLKFLNTLQKFQFSKGISVLGTISGSSLNVDRNATVGGTLTVTGAITGVSTITAKTVLSGNTLVVSNSAKIGGTLSASGTVALEGHLTGATIAGFGLTSCNGGGQVLQWNSATNKFECGVAASVGNGSGGILSLHPTYTNAIYFGSGTTTVGQLSASGNIISGVQENYYHWQTTQAGLQDYWISVRVRLPDNFSSWDPIKPIELRYRTADGTSTNNHVTVRMRNTSGTEVALTGGGGLASASFATANIVTPTLSGAGWAPKGYITVYVKLAALTGKFAEAGFLNLNFETTTP